MQYPLSSVMIDEWVLHENLNFPTHANHSTDHLLFGKFLNLKVILMKS